MSCTPSSVSFLILQQNQEPPSNCSCPYYCQSSRCLHSFSSPASLLDILLTAVFRFRIRRIKCDEAKPACIKCTSTGRTCDGYTKTHDPSPDPPAGSQLVPVPAQSIPNELSVSVDGDYDERRGFHVFQSHFWPLLSSALESVFWERLILQTSHADTAIRHAAIAFGSLGERLRINNVMTFDNEDANRLHIRACSQYHKAIKELREQLSSGQERSVEFTLIACFLFIIFEFLQGNESAALTHLKSGIEIIRQSNFEGVEFDPNIESVSQMESVDFGYHAARVFSVLDRSAANWVATPSFGMPIIIGPKPEYRSLSSEGFSNIDEANNYLMHLRLQLNQIQLVRTLVPGDPNTSSTATTPPLEEVFTNSENWSRAMDGFMARSLSVQEAQKAITLILHHKVTHLSLTASCQASEEGFYRDCKSDFNYIISTSTAILRPNHTTIDFRGSDNQWTEQLFSFRSSLIFPLYFTATHCQDPEIQREALSLLSKSPWREGAWDSAAMARIAERKIRQREQDLSRNNVIPMGDIITRPVMTGYDLQRRQHQVEGSFKLTEDRITELSDSDRSFRAPGSL